jgi:hypothetical protein
MHGLPVEHVRVVLVEEVEVLAQLCKALNFLFCLNILLNI